MIFNLFKKEKSEPSKRDFSNVSWIWKTEINGKQSPAYHLFTFRNGLGVLVFKQSINTYDGMMCIAIDDFTKDGKYSIASGLNVYNRAEGLDESQVKDFCNRIRHVA